MHIGSTCCSRSSAACVHARAPARQYVSSLPVIFLLYPQNPTAPTSNSSPLGRTQSYSRRQPITVSRHILMRARADAQRTGMIDRDLLWAFRGPRRWLGSFTLAASHLPKRLIHQADLCADVTAELISAQFAAYVDPVCPGAGCIGAFYSCHFLTFYSSTRLHSCLCQ